MQKSLPVIVLIGSLALSCFAAPSVPVASADGAIVVVGKTSARFIFPRESTAVLSWDIPASDSYVGSPEHVWSANWEIAEDRLGKDPDGVSADVRYKTGRNKKGSLSELLKEAETAVNTTCMRCGDIPAFTPHVDHAVSASAVDGRVVITVKGAAAVQRLFPVIPDSVYLERYVPGGDRIGFWEVGVRRQ